MKTSKRQRRCSTNFKGDYFFVFDLRSAYHHIDIAPLYEQYLGFEWCNLTRDGAYERKVYLFCSLPFGLTTAPFVFTKVTKALIRYWRSCCLRIFMYLEDGAGAESDQQPAQRMSEKVARDLRAAGFNLSPKRDMVPRQKDHLLGFCVDLANGQFTVTPKRQSNLKDMLSRLQRKGSASARDLARRHDHLYEPGTRLQQVGARGMKIVYEPLLDGREATVVHAVLVS